MPKRISQVRHGVELRLGSNQVALCDPTSVLKSKRLVSVFLRQLPDSADSPRPITHLSPNLLELDVLHSGLVEDLDPDLPTALRARDHVFSLNIGPEWRNRVDKFTTRATRQWLREEGVLVKMIDLLPFVASLWVKAGAKGVLHLRIEPQLPDVQDLDSIHHALSPPHEGFLVLTHYAAIAIPESEIVSTTGAGDTLVGGIVAGLVGGTKMAEAVWVKKALERVRRTMRSRRAVGRDAE